MPFLYNLFQGVVGGNALRRRIIQNHARARTGDKVIDIGCGPAQALQSLPDVEYLGLDINPDYIAFARRTYGDKGTFVVGDTRSLRSDTRFKDADIVIAIAVLHHLDDEDAVDCIRFAHGALKMGGRFISLDPCWIPNQGLFSNISCLMTEAGIFERNNNTASSRRFSGKWMHGWTRNQCGSRTSPLFSNAKSNNR